MTFKVSVLLPALLLLTGFAMVRDGMLLPALHAPAEPTTIDRPAHVHQDETVGAEWIRRLERPSRIPGLRIDDVIAALQLTPGDVVADIGAGTGAFSIAFAKAVAPSGIAYAVDIWPELLDHVRAKAQRESVGQVWMTNVRFHQVAAFDMFQGANNPKGAGMPERWFVVYARKGG